MPEHGADGSPAATQRHTVKEIAARLGISINVRRHIMAAYELQVNSRLEAVGKLGRL